MTELLLMAALIVFVVTVTALAIAGVIHVAVTSAAQRGLR